MKKSDPNYQEDIIKRGTLNFSKKQFEKLKKQEQQKEKQEELKKFQELDKFYGEPIPKEDIAQEIAEEEKLNKKIEKLKFLINNKKNQNEKDFLNIVLDNFIFYDYIPKDLGNFIKNFNTKKVNSGETRREISGMIDEFEKEANEDFEKDTLDDLDEFINDYTEMTQTGKPEIFNIQKGGVQILNPSEKEEEKKEDKKINWKTPSKESSIIEKQLEDYKALLYTTSSGLPNIISSNDINKGLKKKYPEKSEINPDDKQNLFNKELELNSKSKRNLSSRDANVNEQIRKQAELTAEKNKEILKSRINKPIEIKTIQIPAQIPTQIPAQIPTQIPAQIPAQNIEIPGFKTMLGAGTALGAGLTIPSLISSGLNKVKDWFWPSTPKMNEDLIKNFSSTTPGLNNNVIVNNYLQPPEKKEYIYVDSKITENQKKQAYHRVGKKKNINNKKLESKNSILNKLKNFSIDKAKGFVVDKFFKK